MARDIPAPRIVAGPAGRTAYDELSADYHRSLSAPLDDMWAAFADGAEAAAIVIGDRVAGCASVEDSGRLHRFFVSDDFHHRADDCFEALTVEHQVESAVVATVDPGMSSVALPRSERIDVVGLVYEHRAAPTGGSLAGLTPADLSEHSETMTFMEESTGAPEPWLEGYLTERIERRELFLHRIRGEIVGAGECRADAHSPGYAHLGIVVSPSARGRGLGTSLMNRLVEMCDEATMTPMCSTEPDNHPARGAIHRAGFRSRHRIFVVSLESGRRPHDR